jgi:hypothetical protein
MDDLKKFLISLNLEKLLSPLAKETGKVKRNTYIRVQIFNVEIFYCF